MSQPTGTRKGPGETIPKTFDGRRANNILWKRKPGMQAAIAIFQSQLSKRATCSISKRDGRIQRNRSR